MDYDFDSLRQDLEDHFAAESAGFSGFLGFSDMLDVGNFDDKTLLEIAKRERFDLDRYKRK